MPALGRGNLLRWSVCSLLAVVPALAHSKRCLRQPNPEIKWIDCLNDIPPDVLQSSPANSTITIPPTLRCGRISVPLDYNLPYDSNNNSVELAFSLNAVNSTLGLLAYNPGGPGHEVRSFAWGIAGIPISDVDLVGGLEVFDFLALDVRGSGSSAPLNCSSTDFTVPITRPSNASDYDQLTTNIASYTEGCRSYSLPYGLIDHLGTDSIAEDYNAVRRALGYDTLSFVGYSYGTVYGQELIRRHPETLTHVVLDAFVGTMDAVTDVVASQSRGFDRALQRADAYCRNVSCPLEDEGVPQVYQRILNSTTETRTVVPFITFANYFASTLKPQAFIDALQAASQNGSFSGFAFGPELQAAWAQSILTQAAPTICSDFGVSAPKTWTVYDRFMRGVEAQEKYGATFGSFSILAAICSAWDVPQSRLLSATNTTDFPALLVVADFDLNVPTDLSNAFKRSMPNATLIMRHGDDHGSMFVPGPVRDDMLAYLTNGTVPPSAEEELYSVYGPGEVWMGIENPYDAPVGSVAGDVV